MPEASSSEAPRNRAATAVRIVVAAQAVLVEEGILRFGINAVARRAGCDKQLIYRYFGGIDGLLAAIGKDVALRLAEALDPWLDPPPTSYRDFALALARGLLAAYRADPLLGCIRAWEFAEGAGRVAPLVVARGAALAAWVAQARPVRDITLGRDVDALNALVVGAIEAAVLSAAASGALTGVALQTDADWARIEAALEALIRGAYPP